MHDKLRGKLGIAQRAGLISSGQDAVRHSVTSGRAFLLLVAQDAAARTLKEFVLLAEERSLPWRIAGSRQEYGQAIGKPDRAVVAVCDKGMANAILKELGEPDHKED